MLFSFNKQITFTLITVFTTQLHLTAATCRESESISVKNNDITSLVKFISSKDCRFKPELLKSELITNLASHGCWCKTINKQRKYGVPVDKLDEACRNWKQCENCSKNEFCEIGKLSDASKDQYEVKYDATYKKFSCSNTSTCNYNKCKCNLRLAAEVYKNVKLGGMKINNYCDSNKAVVAKISNNPIKFDKCCYDKTSPSGWTRYDSKISICDVENGVTAKPVDKEIVADHDVADVADEEHSIINSLNNKVVEKSQEKICQTCTNQDRWNHDPKNVCFKAHFSVKNKYFMCDHGVAVERTCSGGLVWSQEMLTCTWA